MIFLVEPKLTKNLRSIDYSYGYQGGYIDSCPSDIETCIPYNVCFPDL